MKILMLTPDAWSVFFPETRYIFGGIEMETGIYAPLLAERFGDEVIVVTRDQGQSARRSKGVLLVPHPRLKGKGYWDQRHTLAGRIRYRLLGDKNKLLPDLDFYTGLNPDMVYTQGPTPEGLQLLDYCRSTGKKMVFRVASDLDIGTKADQFAGLENWLRMKAGEVKRFYTEAALVLVQSPFQQQAVKENYGVESIVLLNPIRLPEQEQAAVPKKYDLLWVGKNSPVKRVEIMVQLAKAFPEMKVALVCNKVVPETWQDLLQSLPPNVELIESVPASRIEGYFAAARIFVSTSEKEGFPNTFLQAAKYGVPVLSMNSDPNGMLSVQGAGRCTGDSFEALSTGLQQLTAEPEEYTKASAAALQYVRKYHDARWIVEQLHNAFYLAQKK